MPWYHPNFPPQAGRLIYGLTDRLPIRTTHKNFTRTAPKRRFSLHSYHKGLQPVTLTLFWRNCSLLDFIIAFNNCKKIITHKICNCKRFSGFFIIFTKIAWIISLFNNNFDGKNANFKRKDRLYRQIVYFSIDYIEK